LERHGGPEPIGCRSLVSHGVDRNSVDVLGQPKRPERDILWCFSAPGVSAPSIIGVAIEAMDKNHAGSRGATPTGDLDQPRHATSNFGLKQQFISKLGEPRSKCRGTHFEPRPGPSQVVF